MSSQSPLSVPIPAAASGGPISHAIFRLARIHRMHARHLLRRVGLHPGQELVMMQLWELGEQRQADLVCLLDSDAATMTRTIQRLERAGFVRRRPDPDDGRAYLIEPTVASQALRAQVEQSWAELEGLVTAGMDEKECAQALEVLQHLETNLAQSCD